MLPNPPNSGNLTFLGGGFNPGDLAESLATFTQYEPGKYYWPEFPLDLGPVSDYILELPPVSGILFGSARLRVTSPPANLRMTVGLVAQSKLDPNTFQYFSTTDIDVTDPNGQAIGYAGPVVLEWPSWVAFTVDFAGIGTPTPGPMAILSQVAISLIG